MWCEVKGPHDERLDKTRSLQEGFLSAECDEWSWYAKMVVILRPPGPGEVAVWESVLPHQSIVMVRCHECEHYGWMDFNGIWTCRHHFEVGKTPKRPCVNGGEFLYSGSFQFVRAPRPARKAA